MSCWSLDLAAIIPLIQNLFGCLCYNRVIDDQVERHWFRLLSSCKLPCWSKALKRACSWLRHQIVSSHWSCPCNCICTTFCRALRALINLAQGQVQMNLSIPGRLFLRTELYFNVCMTWVDSGFAGLISFILYGHLKTESSRFMEAALFYASGDSKQCLYFNYPTAFHFALWTCCDLRPSRKMNPNLPVFVPSL